MRHFFLIVLLSIAGIAFAQPVYKIVYNVYDDTVSGNYEIYIMDMDGSNQKNISNYGGMDWVYMTYRDKIYFISDRDTSCRRCYKLYVMDNDGNNKKKISDLVLEDSWMDVRNNGQEMIVSARKGKEVRMQLFLINLQDGSYRQLTNDTAAYYSDPLFSPDGKEIFFRYRADRRNRNMKTELYIMKDDGTGKKQLSFYPKSDTTITAGEYHAGPPRWNRQNMLISYISFQKGKYDVFAITPDGKKQWQITGGELDAGYHDWTPDGKWLVLDMKVPGKKGYDIYLMNPQTKKLTQLTTSWQYENAPSFVEVKKQ